MIYDPYVGSGKFPSLGLVGNASLCVLNDEGVLHVAQVPSSVPMFTGIYVNTGRGGTRYWNCQDWTISVMDALEHEGIIASGTTAQLYMHLGERDNDRPGQPSHEDIDVSRQLLF